MEKKKKREKKKSNKQKAGVCICASYAVWLYVATERVN